MKLSLNGWTPELPDALTGTTGQGRPVMVFIHGGGFTSGSGSVFLYRGGELVRNGDAVVVTINYRLGVFGFFSHPQLSKESEHHASGNYALMDQVAALQWVQKNIASFGGDPQRVTVFGDSAGSSSIANLMGSPRANSCHLRHHSFASRENSCSNSAASRRPKEVMRLS